MNIGKRKFALSPTIIGKDIRLNGFPFTVVGVAPAGFDGDVVGERMALFVPLSMQPQIIRGRHWRNSGNNSWLSLIGRLKPEHHSGPGGSQSEYRVSAGAERRLRGRAFLR